MRHFTFFNKIIRELFFDNKTHFFAVHLCGCFHLIWLWMEHELLSGCGWWVDGPW